MIENLPGAGCMLVTQLSVQLDGAVTVTQFLAWATCTALVLEECHWQRSCSGEAVISKKFLCDWIKIREVLV